MWPNPQETADMVTFTKYVVNGKYFNSCQVVKLWAL